MIIALYARKSNNKETDSIENQLAIMTDYIRSQREFSGCKILKFMDDGFSGINIERDSFQELLALVRQRQVDMIVVKDLSRLGRNYLDISKLVDSIFPFMKVRLIAVADKYDSAHQASNTLDLSVNVKAIMNEFYVHESSEKVYQSCKTRILKGEFLGHFSSYGYTLMDKNTVTINPDEAEIVREIFQMALNGYSAYWIAKELNRRNVPSPQNKKWGLSTVLMMLKNEQYIGKKTALKTKRDVKTKEVIHFPKEQWYVNESAFPPIISCEVFDEVQTHFKQENPLHNTADKHIMCRKLFCAGCGRTMMRDTRFRCRNGYITGEPPCFKGSVKIEVLYDFVLKHVKKFIEPELKRQQILADSSEIKKEIAARKEEKAKLFERLYANDISQEGFQKLNEYISSKIREAEAQLSECQRNQTLTSKYGFKERPIDTFRRLYESDELTAEHMQFVKRIDVTDTEHFEIQMEDGDPLSILCRNVPFYEEW